MQELSRWGGETFGNMKNRIKELKEDIQRLSGRPRTDELVEEETKLTVELDEWLERGTLVEAKIESGVAKAWGQKHSILPC
ncbi:hypothetical protein QQ045_018536 [Rhodiola kirilowii]